MSAFNVIDANGRNVSVTIEEVTITNPVNGQEQAALMTGTPAYVHGTAHHNAALIEAAKAYGYSRPYEGVIIQGNAVTTWTKGPKRNGGNAKKRNARKGK